jgi:hypothetical protein
MGLTGVRPRRLSTYGGNKTSTPRVFYTQRLANTRGELDSSGQAFWITNYESKNTIYQFERKK